MAALERQDLYELLGVPRDAPPDALRRAFRERARALHPDVSTDPGAVARVAAVSHAYEVLSRPASRLLYDRFGFETALDLSPTPSRSPLVSDRPGQAEAVERPDQGAATPADGAAPDDPTEPAPAPDPPRIHDLDVTPLEALFGTKQRIPSEGWRRTRVWIPACAYEGQLVPAGDGRRVRVRIRDRDTRIVRAAAAVGAAAAAALFIVVALAGNSL